MLKKLWLMGLMGMSFSLNAASEFTDQEKLKELKGLIQESLLEVDGALENLRQFMIENNGTSDENQRILETAKLFNCYGLDFIFPVLDPRLFKNKDAVIQIVFPNRISTATYNENIERSVADLVENLWDENYDCDFSLKLVTHAYNQHKICLDRFIYRSQGSKTDISIGAVLNSGMLTAEESALEEYLLGLWELSKGERNSSAKLEFNGKYFARLVVQAVKENGDKELKAFLKGNPIPKDLIDLNKVYWDYDSHSGPDKTVPLGDFLNTLMPEFYPQRDVVLKLIGRTLPVDESKNEGLSAEQKEETKKRYIANSIQNYMTCSSLRIEDITFLFKKCPICVDEYYYSVEEFHDRSYRACHVSLGSQIDKHYGMSGSKIFDLVAPYRNKRELSKEDRKTFIDLLVQCLAAPEGDPLVKKLEAFCAGKEGQLRGIAIKGHLNNEVALSSIFEGLNSKLFPNWKSVMKLAFGDMLLDSHTSTQEEDLQSMEHIAFFYEYEPTFAPLIDSACARFKSHYKLEKKVDLDSIPYEGTTFGEFCKDKKDTALVDVYKKLSGDGVSLKTPKKPGEDYILPNKENAEVKTMPLWKKCVFIGGAAAVTYGLYRYTQKSEKKATSQVA